MCGFTLVEMVVVLGIFAVITSVVLARYKDFSGGIILNNLAYEIGITIREAQVYGLSVKDAGTSLFTVRYGIHLAYPTSNTFVLFGDVDGNLQYTGSSEVIESLRATQGNTIDDFCGQRLDGTYECGKAGTITWLDIMFLRPNPDAIFKSSSGQAYQAATITVKSPGTNKIKTITVRTTGQIAVN